MKGAVVNANQFQSNDRDHFGHVAGLGVKVMICVECIRADGTPIDVAQLLGKGWASNQDLTSSDRAGSCVAWKVGVIRGFWKRVILGFEPYLRSGARVSMRARWISVKALAPRPVRQHQRIRFAGAHYAPDWADRDGSLRERMEAQLLQLLEQRGRAPIVIGADVNDPVRHAAAALGLAVKGAGVMALMYDPAKVAVWNFRVDRWGKRHGATDHEDLIFECRRK